MGTGFIILNLVLAVFVLTAILGLSVSAIRASRGGEIVEARGRSHRRGHRPATRPAAPATAGSRRSGRALTA